MVQNISNMLSMQYHGQILEPASQRPTQQLGMWYSGLFVARFIPVAGGIVGLAGLVVWIMYWSKLHEHYQKLPSQEKEEYALDAGRCMKD